MKKTNEKKVSIRKITLTGLVIGGLIIAGGVCAAHYDTGGQDNRYDYQEFLKNRNLNDLQEIGWESVTENGEPVGIIGKPRALCYPVYSPTCIPHVPY